MNKLRFTSVLIIAALIVTACGSDYATDEMEPDFQLKTRAMKKVGASGEGNIPEEEEDTCTYYMWEALDTTITEYPSAWTDLIFNVKCNEGFSNELRPQATLSVVNYGIVENNSTAKLLKVELGNNGKIHCHYNAHILVLKGDGSYGYEDYYNRIVTAQLKVKEIHVP